MSISTSHLGVIVMILSPLVNPVSEAFSELNKSEIEEVRNDVRLRAKTNPKVKPEIEFYRELGRYIFNPKKIREVYEKYECE